MAKVRVKSVTVVPLGEDGPQSNRSSRKSSKPGEANPKAEEEKSRVPGLPDVGKATKGFVREIIYAMS